MRPYNNHKLEYRSKKCVFLGYSAFHKGYKCLHVPSNRVYISRDVIFDENVFPFANLPSTTTPNLHSSSPVSIDQFENAAYAPALFPNHGAGFVRGARLEVLDDAHVSPVHVDRLDATPAPCMAHAWDASTTEFIEDLRRRS